MCLLYRVSSMGLVSMSDLNSSPVLSTVPGIGSNGMSEIPRKKSRVRAVVS